jgi:hypothetical protein
LRRASAGGYRVEVTGAEFASKYTVLKPLDQRAVRSFVAQEVTTRRAIMLHWLDQLGIPERSAMLARLDRLSGEARERVLGVETVDGMPVVVTRMILDFESFPKWLDRQVPQAPQEAAPPKGGFTDLFVAGRGTPVAPTDSPTVSWTPPAKAEPKAQPNAEPKAEPKISVRFREPGSGPSAPKPAPPPPPPMAPVPPPPAARPQVPAAGEFTQIFGAQHAEPEPAPPPPSQYVAPPVQRVSGPPASATAALERVVLPPPPPPTPVVTPPSPSAPWSGPPPVVPLPPASATPMPGVNFTPGPAAPVMPAQPVQSDFTRIIGAANAPPAAPVSVSPLPPAPAPAPALPAVPQLKKPVLPVAIGLGTLAISALVLVIYFILRHR